MRVFKGASPAFAYIAAMLRCIYVFLYVSQRG